MCTRHEQSDEKAPGDVGNFGDNFKPADEAEYAALQVCSVMFDAHTYTVALLCTLAALVCS
jgi:hypothetical protein